MPDLPTHPDRAAATLANLPDARGVADGPWAPPGAGAADCRIVSKLLQWRALQAVARSPRSAEHLLPYARDRHPDLWAGTVQDGVARGFDVRLEEAIALAPPAMPTAPTSPSLAAASGGGVRITTGRELRKRKDLLVAAASARVRFTRKEGLLFVERSSDAHSANCLRFEARCDRGTLDEFGVVADERPRLYSAQFLQPVRYVEGPAGNELALAGRLGRGPVGWNVELTITGEPERARLRLHLRLDNRQRGWRLRARFLGLPLAMIEHECTPVHEVVANDAGGFVAFTLVRAVDTLRVGADTVPTPAASCQGPIEHTFHLGAPG